MLRFNTLIHSLILLIRNYDTTDIALFNWREFRFESCGWSQSNIQASKQTNKKDYHGFIIMIQKQKNNENCEWLKMIFVQ